MIELYSSIPIDIIFRHVYFVSFMFVPYDLAYGT